MAVRVSRYVTQLFLSEWPLHSPMMRRCQMTFSQTSLSSGVPSSRKSPAKALTRHRTAATNAGTKSTSGFRPAMGSISHGWLSDGVGVPTRLTLRASSSVVDIVPTSGPVRRLSLDILATVTTKTQKGPMFVVCVPMFVFAVCFVDKGVCDVFVVFLLPAPPPTTCMFFHALDR